MSECPKCGYEYIDFIDVCPECGVLLTEMEDCTGCGERIEAEAEYCPYCGILRITPGKDLECENHPDIPAVAVCIICGKPVCNDCRKIRMNKTFCEDDKHIRVFENWAVAYVSSTEYEAEMVKANIENAGIECMIFNQQDHAYFLTVGSMARVNVMVPKEKINDAKKIVETLRTGSDEAE
jgi:hypothetical protein